MTTTLQFSHIIGRPTLPIYCQLQSEKASIGIHHSSGYFAHFTKLKDGNKKAFASPDRGRLILNQEARHFHILNVKVSETLTMYNEMPATTEKISDLM